MVDYLEQLHRVIVFVEEKLGEDIGFRDMASQAAYLSPWHFHRVFEAILGLSPTEYLRERRLRAGAYRPGETEDRLIDIGMDARYEPQEAFTRAFKRRFGTTPGRYRDSGVHASIPARNPYTVPELRKMTEGILMEPTIVNKEEFTVIGLAGPSSRADNRIPALWAAFLQRISDISGRIPGDASYGICEYIDPLFMSEDSEWEELVSVEVAAAAEPPAGMVKRTIPARRYAVFTHRGGVDSLGTTYNYIYKTFLPRSGLQLAATADFEYYDSRFKPDTPLESEMFIYIPLVD